MNLPADLKIAGIAAKIAGVKSIIYRRGMPHPLRNTFLNRFLFTKILTHAVVNSEEVHQGLKKGNEAWFPEEKVVLIYNGVDITKVIDKTQKLYEGKNQEIVIGNIGRLTEQKGQKYLVQMAKLLKNDGVNFKLLIAGDGELRRDLQKQIDDEGLQDQVKLLGHLTDVGTFFNSLDVFVFTSLFEGSANTLIENLQYGIPTVAWNVSSNPEIIQDGKTGFLVEFLNVPLLKEKTIESVKHFNRDALMATTDEVLRSKFDSKKNLDILQKIIS